MLSFELTSEGQEIQIDCDEEGIRTLMTALKSALAGAGRIHLRAPIHGGYDLNEKTAWGGKAVDAVDISWVERPRTGAVLSFEIMDGGGGIIVSCNEEGAAFLVKAFERAHADGDHIHLRTPADGGRDLSEKTPNGDRAIGEVVINWVGE
jgi:hypothetical protein